MALKLIQWNLQNMQSACEKMAIKFRLKPNHNKEECRRYLAAEDAV